MGYTTWFSGEFETNRKMSDDLVDKINKFAEERHCSNDDYNNSTGYPGLYCQWVANGNRYIEWDGGEKFYNYISWLKYIVEHFIKPNDLILNGEVEWLGEDSDDFGKLIVDNNKVYVAYGYKAYENREEVK